MIKAGLIKVKSIQNEEIIITMTKIIIITAMIKIIIIIRIIMRIKWNKKCSSKRNSHLLER